MEYTKAVCKRMRELVSVAYERELRLELEKLADQFQLWKEDKIDTFDLETCVHKFHNGAARTLYNRYTGLQPEMILPYSLKEGIIRKEECPAEIVDDMRDIAKIL